MKPDIYLLDTVRIDDDDDDDENDNEPCDGLACHSGGSSSNPTFITCTFSFSEQKGNKLYY